MKVTVFRYDPTVDEAPRYENYEVPWKEHVTVLEVLRYIYENHTPVAFDYSCRGRVCGRCAMMLDGEPVLACYTTISEERDILIEPLNGFPVIRDFIVDKTKIHRRLNAAYNRIRHKPVTGDEMWAPVKPEIAEKVFPIEWCCRCLSCIASCPVYNRPDGPDNYFGPAGFVALGMRHYDPNDEGDRPLTAVQNGLFECIMCGKCDEVCPADEIKHLSIYTDLRADATAKGYAPA